MITISKNKLNFMLIKAVANGYVNIVADLLELSADVNTRASDTGRSVLHEAVRNVVECKEPLKMLQILFKRNPNVNIQDNMGWTPLHLAVCYRKIDEIKALLTQNPDLSIKDESGNTPLMMVETDRDEKSIEIANLLKEKAKQIKQNKENTWVRKVTESQNDLGQQYQKQ